MIDDAKRKKLKALATERNPVQLKAAMSFLIDKIVTDGAGGNLDAGFTYMWDKDWNEFCALLGYEDKP